MPEQPPNDPVFDACPSDAAEALPTAPAQRVDSIDEAAFAAARAAYRAETHSQVTLSNPEVAKLARIGGGTKAPGNVEPEEHPDQRLFDRLDLIVVALDRIASHLSDLVVVTARYKD